MLICLAALENYKELMNECEDGFLKYGLISYYYLKNQETLEKLLKKVDYLLIDSGGHSFRHGKKINMDEFTNKYVEFVKNNTNNPQILGFFEMDIDNVVGYEKVIEYRKKLESVSDKIIPVWHRERGITNYIEMCKEYSGKRIALPGFANCEIEDGQFNLFINTAHKYNCNVHILGMTRFALIKTLNLKKYDSVDSSTWKQAGVYGTIQLPKEDLTRHLMYSLQGLKNPKEVDFINFSSAKEIQKKYENIDNSVY